MTAALQPSAGRFDGSVHRVAVRCYFEDTDASGVVYHANYLRFMERARSDMLRALGIDQRAAMETAGDERGFYAVRSIEIDYARPAFLDDVLLVESRVLELGAATCLIRQTIQRQDDGQAQTIVDARVLAAYLSKAGRPRRHPPAWRALFERVFDPAAEQQAQPDRTRH